jgi:ERCC4-related helicase
MYKLEFAKSDNTSTTSFSLQLLDRMHQSWNSVHLKKFLDKAKHLNEELGPWAADFFILESIEKLRTSVHDDLESSFGREVSEKGGLLEKLRQIPAAGARVKTELLGNDPLQISPKLARLIEFLISEDKLEFSGLIFVQQRATVSVLSALLSVHPATKSRFKCAPYVGLSNSASRKLGISELIDVKAQQNTLVEFRVGEKNLILATSVLEEGIDITACNVVISFDRLPNLKSFVQRRGRARQKDSSFAVMFDVDDQSIKLEDWRKLEEKMIEAYQDDKRAREKVAAIESTKEDVPGILHVVSTQ